jgi:hypothetical protein
MDHHIFFGGVQMKHNKVFSIGLLVISLSMSLGLGACTSITPSPAELSPFPITGHWKVTGHDAADWTGSDLVIDEIQGRTFSGYFDWYRSGNNYAGREYFTGEYNPQSRTVAMKGIRLVDPVNIVLGQYEAHLARNNLDFEVGSWGGVGGANGDWEARFQQ